LAPHRSSGEVTPLQEVRIINDNETSKLKPGTMETILHQLEIQRVNRPQWIAQHFPRIDDRERVTYEDVNELAPREADAIRFLLVNQYLYAHKQMWKSRGRTVGLREEHDGERTENHWSIRLRLLKEAVTDLCSAFGFPNPLDV